MSPDDFRATSSGLKSGTLEAFLTLSGDLARSDQVALVAHEDYGCLGLSLPQEEPQLSRSVEAPPVGHRKHQNADLALQSREVLRGLRGWGGGTYKRHTLAS